VNPLAGAASNDWQRLRLTNLHNVLVVPWHDTADQVIKVDSSRSLVSILRRLKVDVDYIETRDVGHVPTPAIAEQCYQKLVARRRELYPKQVMLQSNRPDTIFNRVDWLQVYQPMDGGEERRVAFQRVPGHMSLDANAWSAQATINDNNRIDVTSSNVQLLRLSLNDQMIDFAKPVTVRVNNRVRFEGMVTPAVEDLLNDQSFLGRGWRYYSAVIDIDLTAAIPQSPAR